MWQGKGNEHIDKARIPSSTDAISEGGDTGLGLLKEAQKRRQEMVEEGQRVHPSSKEEESKAVLKGPDPDTGLVGDAPGHDNPGIGR